MSVQQRLEQVRARIAAAAAAAGRPAPRLLAVSKRQPVDALREAYAAGQRDFGENYVQELCDKARQLADLPELRLHLIGHLQRNKVKAVLGAASAVHTLDSLRLVEELARRAQVERLEAGRPPLPVLVEVNVGGEAAKSGCTPGELPTLLDALSGARALELRGLMTVPPYTEEPEGARPYFERLAALREALGGAARLPELSMGMSHDLEVAIAAGATLVRVGTAIFGARA